MFKKRGDELMSLSFESNACDFVSRIAGTGVSVLTGALPQIGGVFRDRLEANVSNADSIRLIPLYILTISSELTLTTPRT